MVNATYEAVPGFFLQDGPSCNPEIIGATPPRFGLIDESPDRWTKFEAAVTKLNADAGEGTSYKAFILGRHGEGWHNVAEAKYGTKAWDDYWSKLDGDGEIVWGPDPELTPLGQSQAALVKALLDAEVEAGFPIPDTLYSSPMTRALQTLVGTFGDERDTLILENIREHYGEHTCDKRRPLSYIRHAFPKFRVETGFSEEDALWTEEREAEAHVAERARMVLDTIFDQDDRWLVSITSHSGWINGLLSAIGRERYKLPTGGVLPVVVKQIRR
ncbi:phosphoglycerate mutase-like protein [Gloeophyllum trabeum ATCC 11539]|uniref:Phosphoglycerate mutase-like protein n=1 Tax=Gloeophyllum trabeum (strain ATCC 11539 / FP-39264 / Madison 617) TaxID=670483 RepID=S7RKK6_GLOTA|nr:phosphoglycerate mutase-like protein [Gloeophyllum trabeum ATCC 11539]EPQ54915.1 phosphoglycerate mutase-like protein [Gloeophyllum trabeum ATCC 11539]